MKARHTSLAIALLVAIAMCAPAQAGTNDFFGSSIGGNSTDAPPGANAAAQQMAAGGDYTMDEKRMQKKHRSNVASAQKLIAKGTSMMKSKDLKTSKKGKIFKEIGEKRLAELKANSPFPEIAEKGGKKVE